MVCLAAVCLVLGVATNDADIDAVIPETDVTLLDTDELLEARAISQAAQAEEEAKAMTPEPKEVNAMDELKAYCQVAVQSKFYKNTNNKHKNALFLVIEEYSKNPLSNKHLAGGSSNNIVTQYGLMMGKLEGKYGKGMFKYMLMALDDAVMQGKSPFIQATPTTLEEESTPKKYTIFDYKLLGFESCPDYFWKFEVTPEQMAAAMAAVPKGQSAKAITAKLMKDKKSFYHAALDRLVKDDKAKGKAAFDGAVADSHKAIHKALTTADDKLDNQEVLHPMRNAGVKAALENKVYQNHQPADMAAMKKQALREARSKVRAEAAKANTARITRELEEKARLAAIERAKKEKVKKERDSKERASKERTQKERDTKERSQKERNNKAAAAAEREAKASAMDGQCCLLMWHCGNCCDKCRYGHRWVSPLFGGDQCSTSRRCN